MRAEYTDEQAMLRETLSRLLADTYNFETRRRLMDTPEGWSRVLWSEMAELGLLAALSPEEAGGVGGGGVEAMLIAQGLGAALSAEPFAPTAALAPPVLFQTGRQAALESVMSGACVVAWIEPGSVRAEAGRTQLAGTAISVPWADTADRLLIAAASEIGPMLIWADPSGEGILRRPHRTFDGLAAADVSFNDAPINPDAVLATGQDAEALIARASGQLIAWLTAEAVGLMEVVLEATVDHLKSRKQFGQPLAAFQSLQHRAAEMLIALEQGRSGALLAAGALDEPDLHRQAWDLAAAKLVVSDSARSVAQAAVQLHGGIGVTEEHKVGWAFRRLTMIEMLGGDADVQAARLAERDGLAGAE